MIRSQILGLLVADLRKRGRLEGGVSDGRVLALLLIEYGQFPQPAPEA